MISISTQPYIVSLRPILEGLGLGTSAGDSSVTATIIPQSPASAQEFEAPDGGNVVNLCHDVDDIISYTKKVLNIKYALVMNNRLI